MKPNKQFLTTISFKTVEEFRPYIYTNNPEDIQTHRSEQYMFQISETFETSLATHIKPQHIVYISM